MPTISAQSTRSSGRAQNYAKKDCVAISAIGASVPMFEQRLAEIRAAHGKDGMRPQYAFDENGSVLRDENGEKIVATDSRGRPIYESRYVQAYSIVQSFSLEELDPHDPQSWERAQQLGRAVVERRAPGHPALIATEINGRSGLVHNHIILGAVNAETGKSLDSDLLTHARLAILHDEVLAEHGFEQREDMRRAVAEAKQQMDEVAEQVRQQHEGSGISESQLAKKITKAQNARVKVQSTTELSASEQREQRRMREHDRYLHNELDRQIALDVGVTPPPERFSETVLESRIRSALADPRSQSWESLAETGLEHGVKIARRGQDVSYGMILADSSGELVDEPARAHRRRGKSLGEGFRVADVEAIFERNAELQVSAQRSSAEIYADLQAQIAEDYETEVRPLIEAEAERVAGQMAESAETFQQEQAAREAERRAILDNPPASLAGLSDEELAQRVDRQVVVSYDFVSGGPTRTADRERMAREHGLTREEIAYLDEVWWDLDRPETASERPEHEQVETLDQTDDSSAPEPAPDPEAVQARQLDEQERPAEVQPAAEQLAITAEQPQETEEVAEQAEIDSELEIEDSGELEQEQAEVEQPEHSEARAETQQPEAAHQAAEQETSHVEDAEPVFRSRLRGMDLSGRTEQTKQKAAGLAQLEEDYHGRAPDAEFERRIADRDGEIAGIGPKALEVFSPYLSDEMRGHLESRLSHQRATQTAWEKGETHRERAERIERTDPLGLRSDELHEERWQADFQSRRVDRLRQEQSHGIYDQETPAAQAEAAEFKQHVIDRGSRVETSKRRTRLEQSMSSLERDVAAAHSHDQDQEDELERG